MAYSSYDYDHDDDHRPRHSASRRDDDYATPPSRHHDHSKYPPHEQPVRSRPSVVPTDGSRDYSYDARYRNPLPPRTSSFRSERRARPRWPPQPTVEDEAESLIKEHGAHTSLHGENLEGWVMRGTVDQEPIMVEVSPQPNNSDNQERRFVLVPGSEAEETEFEETPIYPRREPSPYAFTKPDVSSKGRSAGDSFLSPDTVTPSSATRPNRRPDETASSRKSNRNSFLSPESYQNTGALEDSDLSEDESIKLRTERKPARYSFSPAELKKEDLRTSLRDLEPKFEKDRPSARPRSTSTAYSFSPADLKKEDLRTSLRDPEPKIERDRPSGRPRSVSTAYSFGPGELRTEDHKAPLRNPEPVRERVSAQQAPPANNSRAYSPPSPPFPSNRRTAESAATTTPPYQSSPQDLPWARPTGSRRTTYDTLYDNTSSQRISSKIVSRPASPISRENTYPPSPPRSPSRLQTGRNDKKLFVETRSRPPSRTGSRAPSPLQTSFAESEPAPSPPVVKMSRSPRVATFPIAASAKDHATRRVSRQDMSASEPDRVNSLPPAPRVDVQSPSPARPAKPPTSLPYPDDDMNVLMPQEDRFQYDHDSPRRPMTAGFDYPRPPSVAPNAIPSRLKDDRPLGHVPMRRTFSETSVHTEPLVELPHSRDGRSNGIIEYPSSPIIKTLSPCPRPGYSSNYEGWYTIEGCPSVRVCLDCLQDIVGRSRYRDYFVRAPRGDTTTRKTCDLSVPWFRIAWLLTIKESRPSLDLIRTLATIRDQERECPGSSRVMQAWYGVKNIHNKHVSNMFICQRDRRYIEALLPSLRGQFTRVETVDSTVPRMCSLRTESHRFEKYMDLLVDIHDKASKNRRTPDMLPFIELATHNAWKSECPRDNIIFDGLWHIIPGLPELTVCEECYDDIIYPLLKSGNSIADAFTRTMQSVPQETLTGIGSSCQLYSPRMRRVFQRAVKDEDLGYGYLVKKARERKKVELALQAQHKALRKLIDDNTNASYRMGYRDYHGGGGLDPERIRRELEDIAREWRDWE